MKKIEKFITSFFASLAKARAATYYVRQGNHEAARKVMLD